MTEAQAFSVSASVLSKTRGGGCIQVCSPGNRSGPKSNTHSVPQSTRSQQVPGPRRSGCREDGSPYNCCNNPGQPTGDDAKCPHPAGRAMGAGAPMHGPTLCCLRQASHTSAVQAPPAGAPPSPQRRDLSSSRHLLSVAASLPWWQLWLGKVYSQRAPGAGGDSDQWAHLGPLWIRLRQGVQKSGPEPQPLLDSQGVCLINEGRP